MRATPTTGQTASSFCEQSPNAPFPSPSLILVFLSDIFARSYFRARESAEARKYISPYIRTYGNPMSRYTLQSLGSAGEGDPLHPPAAERLERAVTLRPFVCSPSLFLHVAD